MTALASDLLRAVHDERFRQAKTARRIGQAQRATARPGVTHGRIRARFTLPAWLSSSPV